MKKLLSQICRTELCLPLSSAILLVLSFYPFDFWPLVFIALSPMLYFVYRSWERGSGLFWGMFLVSFFPILSISYWNLSDFTWAPEAHLFQTFLRFIPLPLAFFFGIIAGGISVLISRLIFLLKKPDGLSPAYLIFIFPIFFTLAEISISLFSNGYDYSILAYAVHTQPLLVSLAAIGGAHLVSFAIITINAVIATAFYIALQGEDLPLRRRLARIIPIATYAVGAACSIGIGAYGYDRYLHHDQETSTIRVALLQNADRLGGVFGSFDTDGVFRYEKLESLVRQAKQSSPDIIIYPYGPTDYLLSASSTSVSLASDIAPLASITEWVASTTPHTTLVTWDTMKDSGAIYDVVHIWRQGRLYGSYAKEIVFPFMDYTPQWAENAGFYTTPYDIAPATWPQHPTQFDDVRLGSAVCSEFNERGLVRNNAQGANLFLSVGSDAMFSNEMTNLFTLASAQFRAVENNIPVIRADRFGPSAIIDPHGSIVAYMSPGEDGVLVRPITFEVHPRETLYQITGDWLLVAACVMALLFL